MKSDAVTNEFHIPGQLLKYMFFFWLAAANVGADIALLFNAARGMGVILLLIFLVTSTIVTIWMGAAIIRFHQQSIHHAKEEEIPELV